MGKRNARCIMKMEKFYVIESVANPGSFYAGKSYGEFVGWIYAKEYKVVGEAEMWVEIASEIEPCKIVEAYKKRKL